MKRVEGGGGRSESSRRMKFTINKELGRERMVMTAVEIAQDRRFIVFLSTPTANTCSFFLVPFLSPLPCYMRLDQDCD